MYLVTETVPSVYSFESNYVQMSGASRSWAVLYQMRVGAGTVLELTPVNLENVGVKN